MVTNKLFADYEPQADARTTASPGLIRCLPQPSPRVPHWPLRAKATRSSAGSPSSSGGRQPIR